MQKDAIWISGGNIDLVPPRESHSTSNGDIITFKVLVYIKGTRILMLTLHGVRFRISIESRNRKKSFLDFSINVRIEKSRNHRRHSHVVAKTLAQPPRLDNSAVVVDACCGRVVDVLWTSFYGGYKTDPAANTSEPPRTPPPLALGNGGSEWSYPSQTRRGQGPSARTQDAWIRPFGRLTIVERRSSGCTCATWRT